LSNAQRLMEYAARSYEVLYGGEKSVLGGLKLALQDIREIKGIDSSLRVSPEELDSLFFLLEDAAVALREYAGRVVFDPQRLSEVDERLALLAGLKRKYGGSLDAVLRTGEALESELGGMSAVEEEISVVETEASALKELLLEQARGLTAESDGLPESSRRPSNGKSRRSGWPRPVSRPWCPPRRRGTGAARLC